MIDMNDNGQHPLPEEGVAAGRQYTVLLPVLVGCAAFAVYTATLAPTVTSEDSGEFIGAADFWGVAHPPGYPLWTMLCGAFLRLVPLGNIAWRCNLFSAVCAAIAVAVLCRVLILVGIRPLAALTGALVCAFGRVLWSQSVITEVYTLHLLTVMLVIWAGLRWEQTRSERYLILACLFFGLGMSNHQTMGYVGVAVAAWVLVLHPRLIARWRLALVATIAFVVGLLPHVYILVRAKADPPVNWGNANKISAVWDHVSRSQYKAAVAAEQARSHPWVQKRVGELKLIGQYCGREYTPILLIGAVPGLFIMLARRFRRFLLLWLLVVMCSVVIHIIATDFEYDDRVNQWCSQVFFLPLYSCIPLALAFTLHGFMVVADRFARRTMQVIMLCLVIGVPAVPLVVNFRQNNMRRYWYAYDHGRNILDSMLPNAIIFPSGDHNTFPLIYLVLVEKYRPDVVIADKYGYIDLDLYCDMPDNPGKPRTLADRDRIEEWVIRHAKRPVYYTTNRQSLIPNAHMVQTGILYHLLPEGRTIDSEEPWKKVDYRNLARGMEASRDFGADNILADYEFFRGLRELNRGDRTRALEHFAKSTDYAAGIKEVRNNIGSALAESGHDDDAIPYYRQAADLDARYCPPRWNLARMYKRRGEYEKAEQMFTELSQADPKDFRVWGELGFLAARVDRGREAVAYWEKSLTLNPAQPQIIEQLYFTHFGASTSQPASSPDK